LTICQDRTLHKEGGWKSAKQVLSNRSHSKTRAEACGLFVFSFPPPQPTSAIVLQLRGGFHDYRGSRPSFVDYFTHLGLLAESASMKIPYERESS
jgi:hypothetical protein